MPDETTDKPEETGTERERRSVGRRLREKRKSRGISIKQAAQDLHVDDWIVRALEADNFSALGAPVFAKGHLRKYADLLGFEADELMIDYYQSQDVPETPSMVTESATAARPERSRWPLRIIVLLGILGLVIVLVWYVIGNDTTTSTAVTEPPAPVSEAVEAGAPAVDSGEPESGAPSADTAEPGLETAPPDEPAVETRLPETQADEDDGTVVTTDSPREPLDSDADVLPATPGTDVVELRLSFSQDSWVEISDGQGRRMMYGMGRADTVRVLQGVPPIRVLFGLADGVTLEVDGQPYPLPPRRGDTARFRIDGPPGR